MSRKNKPGKMSLKQEIRNKALEGLTDNDSRKTYRAGIDKFFAWIRPEDGPERFSPVEIRTAPQEAIQAFADHLAAAGKSAATIHTRIASVCKGCGVTMDQIRKPTRKAVAITRSREKPGRDRSGEVYKLRGELRTLALQKGRPVEYDRVALMAVSVFHLSHWRNEVTISHYMV